MSKKLYEESNIQDIANAIREQNGTENTYTPAQMPAAIRAIEPEPDLETLTATENGNYLPSAGKDGFSSVAVNVPTGGGGAVVQPLSVSENGTYNPPSGVDGYAPVTVNVPSGGGGDIVYIPYDPEYEQGTASGVGGNTYAANKVSNTTRIRPADLVSISDHVNDYIWCMWDDSNYDIAIQQYDSNMRGAAFGEFRTKSFSASIPNPYIDIIIRKKNNSAILPSEFASVQLKLISLTKSDFDPSHGGGILTGLDAPSASLGNDGDIYKQEIPIPSNVNFVEYLASSGTQYIDTGIIADQGTDVVCDSEYKGNDFIIGCRTGSAGSASKALMITGTSSGISAYKSSNNGSVSDYVVNTLTGYKCKSAIKTIHDGAIGRVMLVPRSDASTTYARSISNFAADYSQVLFGIKQSSTPSLSIAKLYRVTYFQYGSPIADYLPCLDGNGVACMWDNIAGEYVYNDGTGDFAYGNTITPTPLDDVYYLKENGAWHVIEQ